MLKKVLSLGYHVREFSLYRRETAPDFLFVNTADTPLQESSTEGGAAACSHVQTAPGSGEEKGFLFRTTYRQHTPRNMQMLQRIGCAYFISNTGKGNLLQNTDGMVSVTHALNLRVFATQGGL